MDGRRAAPDLSLPQAPRLTQLRQNTPPAVLVQATLQQVRQDARWNPKQYEDDIILCITEASRLFSLRASPKMLKCLAVVTVDADPLLPLLSDLGKKSAKNFGGRLVMGMLTELAECGTLDTLLRWATAPAAGDYCGPVLETAPSHLPRCHALMPTPWSPPLLHHMCACCSLSSRRMVPQIEQVYGPPRTDEWLAFTAKLFADSALGLAHCHNRKRALLHLDVKPGNIFLSLGADGCICAKVRRRGRQAAPLRAQLAAPQCA